MRGVHLAMRSSCGTYRSDSAATGRADGPARRALRQRMRGNWRCSENRARMSPGEIAQFRLTPFCPFLPLFALFALFAFLTPFCIFAPFCTPLFADPFLHFLHPFLPT